MNDRPQQETVPEYAILGCGSVGHVVATRLHEDGEEIIIFDKDPSRVEALRDQDMNAVERDITDPEVADIISDTPVALVLTSFVEENKKALRNLKEENPDQYVIVRATDPVSHDEIEDEGADEVINPPQVIAESALRALEAGEMENRVERFLKVIEDSDSLGVVVYRSFEPDEIASAYALKSIAEELGVETEVVYCGSQRRRQNVAFANLIDLEIDSDEGLSGFDTVAVVECADGAEGFEFDADVVIDHNPTETGFKAEYTDIRSNVGSTSTILTKYLQETEVSVSNTVHTALLHGIRSETSYFRRETTPADLTAAAYLFPFADKDLLEDLESPSMSADEFGVLSEAIRNRDVIGSNLVSNVGFLTSPDALSWSAEELLDLEGVATTVVFGVSDDMIHIAGQSRDARVNLGDVLEEAFADEADTVGHSDEARASVPLGIFRTVGEEQEGKEERDVLIELVDETVKTKLFEAMNVDEED